MFIPSQRNTGPAAKAAPLFNNLRHTRLPGSRWEVSPGHTCGARESQVNKIALPPLATGDPIAPKGYQRAELRRRTRC